MTRFYVFAAIGMMLGACVAVETSTTQQNGETMQGETMQGETMQGETMQGMSMRGIRFQGATLAGVALTNVRIERGELVAQRGPDTLRGTSLEGAHLLAEVQNTEATSATVEYRISEIEPELSQYDRTPTGYTFLYTLEQWVSDSGSWQMACPTDSDGRNVAIPVAAIWDEHGDRSASSTLFTFGCTTGVIAKCYRWGYRPWVTGNGDMVTMHWTCTRLARADYCGDGTPHTHDGTKINVWDTLTPQIQQKAFSPLMLFEAGWNTGGAVCLSHARWVLDDGPQIAQLCPQRLVPPGVGQTVCNNLAEAMGYDGNAKMFNEAKLNIHLF